MLFGEPRPSFLIGGLPEENAQMKQVAELVALVNVYVHAMLSIQPALLMFYVGVNGTDELAIAAFGSVSTINRVRQFVRQVCDAAVEQQLDMASELRKLLDHQVLLGHELFKLLVIDGSQVQIRRVGLIVKCKVNAIRVFLFGPQVVIRITVFVTSFNLFI